MNADNLIKGKVYKVFDCGEATYVGKLVVDFEIVYGHSELYIFLQSPYPYLPLLYINIRFVTEINAEQT